MQILKRNNCLMSMEPVGDWAPFSFFPSVLCNVDVNIT